MANTRKKQAQAAEPQPAKPLTFPELEAQTLKQLAAAQAVAAQRRSELQAQLAAVDSALKQYSLEVNAQLESQRWACLKPAALAARATLEPRVIDYAENPNRETCRELGAAWVEAATEAQRLTGALLDVGLVELLLAAAAGRSLQPHRGEGIYPELIDWVREVNEDHTTIKAFEVLQKAERALEDRVHSDEKPTELAVCKSAFRKVRDAANRAWTFPESANNERLQALASSEPGAFEQVFDPSGEHTAELRARVANALSQRERAQHQANARMAKQNARQFTTYHGDGRPSETVVIGPNTAMTAEWARAGVG